MGVKAGCEEPIVDTLSRRRILVNCFQSFNLGCIISRGNEMGKYYCKFS